MCQKYSTVSNSVKVFIAALFLGLSIWSLIQKTKGMQEWIYYVNLAGHIFSLIFSSILCSKCVKGRCNIVFVIIIGLLGCLTSIFYGIQNWSDYGQTWKTKLKFGLQISGFLIVFISIFTDIIALRRAVSRNENYQSVTVSQVFNQ